MKKKNIWVIAALGLGVVGLLAFIGYPLVMRALQPSRDNQLSPPSGAASQLSRIPFLQDPDFKLHGHKDVNANRVPEYGTMSELVAVAEYKPDYIKPKGNDIWEQCQYRYLFKVHLPPDPADAEKYWCAVAWPADPKSAKKWPSFFVDSNRIMYETKDGLPGPLGRMPELTDIYVGKPYISPVNLNIWREMPK